MKLTSRMKFALMQRFIINMIFLLLLAWVTFLYLYKEIQTFETLKTQLSTDFDYYAQIQKNGIDFQKLMEELRSSWQLQDTYLRNVFSQVTPQFFTTHFSNKWSESFESFLNTKSQEIDAIKATPEYQERYAILDDILPVYSPGIKITDNDLTNAEFINSVENLLYRFNLTHRGEIWIQNLTLIENTPSTPTDVPQVEQQSNNLSENIFVIPLELNIEGMKWNIVNFLHYLSHVGSVSANTANNTLIPYTDTFLGGSADLNGWSRYLWQLKTIDTLEFQEYIDSSPTQSSENFIARLRSPSQFRERYRVRMVVNFYVAGYPQYRINQAIEELTSSLQESLTEMSEWLQKSSEAFDGSETERGTTQRTLARTVTRIKERFAPIQLKNIIELDQDEVIELYTELLQLKTLEEMVRENYTLFMR